MLRALPVSFEQSATSTVVNWLYELDGAGFVM